MTLILLGSQLTMAQNTYEIKVGSNGSNFSPKITNCQVGDTVRFLYVSGSNPTRSDDGNTLPLFTVSASNPVKTFVMTSTGSIPYHSITHGDPGGIGMSGQINVNGLTSALATKALANTLSVYPNPAEDKINVNFVVKREAQVVIRLLDVLGNDVAVLHNERLNIGDYKLSFNVPNRVTKGLYFVKVSVASEVAIKRISIQ